MSVRDNFLWVEKYSAARRMIHTAELWLLKQENRLLRKRWYARRYNEAGRLSPPVPR